MKKLKEARLIVRNIPFKASEDDLTKHFSQCGKVSEVNVLRTGSKMVGCGFVQFDNKLSAAKAISKLSGHPFLGRAIVVDWAVSKRKYSQVQKTFDQQVQNLVKKENSEDVEIDIKKEECSETSSVNLDLDEVAKKVEKSHSVRPITKFNRVKDNNDDNEGGCTVFIKNIPYSATNDDLKNVVEKFGSVIYALICIDSMTEHSKGSGFVKFKDKKSADACLQAGSELNLNGFMLEPQIAISKDKLNKNSESSSKKKDKRNLYLAKEGVVLPGTPAAVGVSNSDMSKRMELENWKTQKLRNLNMFVSNTRLIVHNIPQYITDNSLTKIFKEHVSNTTPCEVKIMRDLHNINENGVGKSKEYGFVAYNNHEDALLALRAINNNPHIFNESKRPIVTFSIENKKIVEMKKSRFKKHTPKINETRNIKQIPPEGRETKVSSVQGKTHEGLQANLGSKKLFSKYVLKKKMDQHLENNKKSKSKKQMKETRKNQRINKGKEEYCKMERKNEMSDIIEKYKTKICNSAIRKKWFE